MRVDLALASLHTPWQSTVPHRPYGWQCFRCTLLWRDKIDRKGLGALAWKGLCCSVFFDFWFHICAGRSLITIAKDAERPSRTIKKGKFKGLPDRWSLMKISWKILFKQECVNRHANLSLKWRIRIANGLEAMVDGVWNRNTTFPSQPKFPGDLHYFFSIAIFPFQL